MATATRGFGEVAAEKAAIVELKSMNKTELMELVQQYEEALCYVDAKIGKGKKFRPGRKDEVLRVLKAEKRITVAKIAAAVGITARNVSSQLSYLRKDGYEIMTDSKGHKMLVLED